MPSSTPDARLREAPEYGVCVPVFFGAVPDVQGGTTRVAESAPHELSSGE
jgi:hypothetical protein